MMLSYGRFAPIPCLLTLVTAVGAHGSPGRDVEAHPSRRLVKVVSEAAGLGSMARESHPLPPNIIGVDTGDGLSGEGTGSIEWSEPDYIATALAIPTSDPIIPWSLADTNIQDAWTVTKGDTKIRVCVIDSGIDSSHSDLQGTIAAGYDATTRRWGHVDTNGHGTMVVGILAASPNNSIGIPGVLWNGSVDSCRFLGDDGRGYLSDAIECLRWYVHGMGDTTSLYPFHSTVCADVLSLSLPLSVSLSVSPRLCLPALLSLTDTGARLLTRCIVERQAGIVSNSWGTYARSRALWEMMEYYERVYGVIYVAAAGNEGVDNDSKYEAMYPASYNLSNIVSVAATTRFGTLAPFSNYASRGESVDIAAPGVEIVSTFPGNTYRSMSGTSFAVPLVTGTLALMMSTSIAPEMSSTSFPLSTRMDQVLLESSTISPILDGLVAGGRSLDAYRAVRHAASFFRNTSEVDIIDDPNRRLHPVLEHARLLDAAPLSDGSRYREQLRFPGDAMLNESALTDEIFADCPSSRYTRYDIKGLLGDVLIAKQIFAIKNTDTLADRYRYLQIDTCAMKPTFDSIMVVLDCETEDILRGCRCLRSNDGCKRRRAGSKIRAELSAGHTYIAVVFASDPMESGGYRLRLKPENQR